MDEKVIRRGLVLFRDMLMVCDNEGVLTREERELATEFADEVRRLRAELLAYREGYAPSERLPPDGEEVWTDCIYAPGFYPATHDSVSHVWRGETIEGEWEVEDGSPDITRWYPTVGGVTR